MSMPIIFIHRTDDEYLKYSLSQAKRSNISSDVILIGTDSNSKYCTDSAQHFMIQDYNQGALDFAKIYKHETINDYEYNLFCFQQWFIVRDFMKANHIPQCCFLNTDVMLYEDVNKDEFKNFSLVFSWFTISKLKDIENLCDLMTDYFHDPRLFEILKNYTQDIAQPGISDMVLTNLYLDFHPSYKQNIEGIFDNSFFDGNINCPLTCPYGIDTVEDKKKIYLIKGEYYCKQRVTNKYFKANTLHFQADSKQYMKYFSSQNHLTKTDEETISYFDYNTFQWLPVSSC